MSREIGLAFGASLDSFAVGLRDAERAADDLAFARRRDADARMTVASLANDDAANRLGELERVVERLNPACDTIVAMRTRYPTEFSLPRGLFYLAVASVLFVGDATILSGVLAQLLNLPLVDTGTGVTVADLVSDPIKALHSFPHVVILTASVLLLGFFPKVYLELPDEVTPRVLRWTVRGLLLLSCMAVLLTALARSALPVAAALKTGQSDLMFRLATICLGIALPYVGGIFFIRGADKIGRRLDLWRLRATTWIASRRLQAHGSIAAARAAELASAEAELGRVRSPEFLGSCRAAAVADFSHGYAEAAASLLEGSTPGSVFAALRSVAIRRALRKSA
jgi:hypothetical protein